MKTGPCSSTQIKTKETDGYKAIQVGFGEAKEKTLNEPKKGHIISKCYTLKKHLQEFRVDSVENTQLEKK